MPTTVFFSWQADRPTRTGRNLVERALERAVGELRGNVEVDEAVRDVRVDRDTKDVPGSPPIVDTIFAKIDAASIFLPDLTFVGVRADGRPTSNPNVLIEYGWALKRFGHGRMVCVMNTAYGKPSADTLPFDMQHLRHPITYHCPEDADEDMRRTARDALAKSLAQAIRLIIDGEDFRAAQPKPPAPPTFPRREPMDGPARFRPRGESLGVVDALRMFGVPVVDLKLTVGKPTWLRLIPTVDPGRRWKWADLKQAGGVAVPLYAHSGGFGHLRAEDGFGIFSTAGSDDVTDSVTMVFDTGEIWSIDSHAIDAVRDDYLPLMEREFVEALGRFTGVMRDLGVPGPFRWVAGMSGVRGRGLATLSGNRLTGTCVTDDIVLGGGHDYEAEPAASLEPYFGLVFERCGVDRAEWNRAVEARSGHGRPRASLAVPRP